MNEITTFAHEEFGEVRTLEIDGEPWFVGKDVATILGYAKPSIAISKKVAIEDKGVSKMETPGGIQDVVIINESGLYSLILSSKLESAKRFKKWVTSEVLPTIRKHGAYMTPETLHEAMTKPENLIVLLESLYNEQKKNITLTAENQLLTEQASEWADKKILVALVRKYASARYGSNFKLGWNCFYKELRYNEGIDLSIRKGKCKKNTRYINLLSEEEIKTALKIAAAMCRTVGVDIESVVGTVNAAKIQAAS